MYWEWPFCIPNPIIKVEKTHLTKGPMMSTDDTPLRQTIPGELLKQPVTLVALDGHKTYGIDILRGDRRVATVCKDHPCGEFTLERIAFCTNIPNWIGTSLSLRRKTLEFILETMDGFDAMIGILPDPNLKGD